MIERVNSISINRVLGDVNTSQKDLVVVEEPLEIRIGYGPQRDRQQVTITVTMRTPGDDEHLCMDFYLVKG